MNNLALLTFSKLNQCGLWVDPNSSLQNLLQSKGWYLVSCSVLNMFNSSPQLDLVVLNMFNSSPRLDLENKNSTKMDEYQAKFDVENKNSTVRWMTIRQTVVMHRWPSNDSFLVILYRRQ